MRPSALFMVMALILAAGVFYSAVNASDSPSSIIKRTDFYSEICVDGVVYLRSPNGALTPKVNADFYPYICEIQGENNE